MALSLFLNYFLFCYPARIIFLSDSTCVCFLFRLGLRVFHSKYGAFDFRYLFFLSPNLSHLSVLSSVEPLNSRLSAQRGQQPLGALPPPPVAGHLRHHGGGGRGRPCRSQEVRQDLEI